MQQCYCNAAMAVLAAYSSLPRRTLVNKISMSIAAAAALSVSAATVAFAAELPSYETTGLPISAVQLRVLGAANVQQQLPAATSTVTPVQLSVLTPRKKLKTATVAPGQTETGRATR
jgi:hypothetical protein